MLAKLLSCSFAFTGTAGRHRRIRRNRICDGRTITTPNGGKTHAVPEELWKTCWEGPSPMMKFKLRFNAWAADLKAGNPHPTMHLLSPRQWRLLVRANELMFTMPRWRFDLLHPVDLVEELAIDG